MHEDIRAALKQAVMESSAIVREHLDDYTEPCLSWRKNADGRWEGDYHDRPNFHRIFRVTRDRLNAIAAGFASQFMAHYPDYSGPVGVTGARNDRTLTFVTRVPEYALGWLRYKHGSLDFDDSLVDAIVDEFAEFMERPTVRLRVQGQLLNFSMDADRLVLPNDLVIRRLSEKDVSVLDGGSLLTLGFMRPRFGGPHEFVLEMEADVPKESGNVESHLRDLAKDLFDRAILCLRTFKAGRVGYDYIHFSPVKFCQVAMSSSCGCGDAYVPFGSYRVSKEEETPFCDHAAMLFKVAEPAMDTALGRLADAETRTRPNDRLIDAVIGMEAMLLAGLRGELRYRFSLHYSTLFDSPEERFAAFREAKDLYDLRSTIAHGAGVNEKRYRIGRDKFTLAEAAMRATEALRSIVRRFLPQANKAPYKKPEFWERAYFGLPEDGHK